MSHTHTIITHNCAVQWVKQDRQKQATPLLLLLLFFFCCHFTHYICFFCINETLASTRRLWQTTEALFYSPTPPLPQALQAKLARQPAERHCGRSLAHSQHDISSCTATKGCWIISCCKVFRHKWHHYMRTWHAGVGALFTACDSEPRYQDISFLSFRSGE